MEVQSTVNRIAKTQCKSISEKHDYLFEEMLPYLEQHAVFIIPRKRPKYPWTRKRDHLKNWQIQTIQSQKCSFANSTCQQYRSHTLIFADAPTMTDDVSEKCVFINAPSYKTTIGKQ